MKAILEYDLNDPDEAMAHLRAIKSTDLSLAIWELCHNTKKRILSKVETNEIDAYDAVELVFEEINVILSEHDINIDRFVS